MWLLTLDIIDLIVCLLRNWSWWKISCILFVLDKNTLHIPCSICHLGKQRRLSFVSNNHSSTVAFDLIHWDTSGPYYAPTHAGYKYFLTLVDNCTCFTWIYLFRQKFDVSFIVPKFFTLIETQFHKLIKKFKYDNAPDQPFAIVLKL